MAIQSRLFLYSVADREEELTTINDKTEIRKWRQYLESNAMASTINDVIEAVQM